MDEGRGPWGKEFAGLIPGEADRHYAEDYLVGATAESAHEVTITSRYDSGSEVFNRQKTEVSGKQISLTGIGDLAIVDHFSLAKLGDIPERAEDYPESKMLGVLPAWGWYCRHAEGVVMENVTFSVAGKDYRACAVFHSIYRPGSPDGASGRGRCRSPQQQRPRGGLCHGLRREGRRKMSPSGKWATLGVRRSFRKQCHEIFVGACDDMTCDDFAEGSHGLFASFDGG